MKWFLKEIIVLVNGELDDWWGWKFYLGDMIEVEDNGLFFICLN